MKVDRDSRTQEGRVYAQRLTSGGTKDATLRLNCINLHDREFVCLGVDDGRGTWGDKRRASISLHPDEARILRDWLIANT